MAKTIREINAEKKNVAGCFRFLSEEDAVLAREEIKKVQYLERHMDYHSLDTLYKIYTKALEDRTFQTPEGLAFVIRIRQILIEGGMEEDALEPISIHYDITPRRLGDGYAPLKNPKPKLKIEEKKSRLITSIVINIVLALLVVGMFVLAMTGNNPNILNYKRALENQYAAWEQDLTERENILREKELELNRE